MPYKSAKQRRFMYAKKPKIAKRWSKKYGAKVGGGFTKKQKAKRRRKKR